MRQRPKFNPIAFGAVRGNAADALSAMDATGARSRASPNKLLPLPNKILPKNWDQRGGSTSNLNEDLDELDEDTQQQMKMQARRQSEAARGSWLARKKRETNQFEAALTSTAWLC